MKLVKNGKGVEVQVQLKAAGDSRKKALCGLLKSWPCFKQRIFFHLELVSDMKQSAAMTVFDGQLAGDKC